VRIGAITVPSLLNPGPNTKVAVPGLGYIVLNRVGGVKTASGIYSYAQAVVIHANVKNQYIPEGVDVAVLKTRAEISKPSTALVIGDAYGTKATADKLVVSDATSLQTTCQGTEGKTVKVAVGELNIPKVAYVGGVYTTKNGAIGTNKSYINFTSHVAGVKVGTLSIGAIESSVHDSSADAIAALRSYFIEELSQRRASPGDDLISVLVSAQDETDTLRLDELLALVLLSLFAGDTTTNLIANGLLALSSHPDQLRRLGLAPEVLTPNAVEEVLRYDSPVQMVMRFCTRDTHVGETTVPGGAVVLVLIGAANRDPAQFHAPDSFDIARHPNNHVAFGDGIHACIGAHLARLQGRIVLGSVVERFPRLRLSAPDQPLKYGGYLLSRGLTSLPMVID